MLFALATLAYMAWVVYLGQHNFDMVHREYARATKRLQPAVIEEIARQELIEHWRHESPGQAPPAAWPEPTLGAQEKEVFTRLTGEKARAGRKLALFYLFFGVIFLILPPTLAYLLLSFLAWIYQSVQAGKRADKLASEQADRLKDKP